MRGFYRAVKRFLDVTASFLGLVLLSPLLLAVSIMIKIDSRGPVIFRQEKPAPAFIPERATPGLQG